MSSFLITGANGATGRHVVEQLLNMNQFTRVIVRSRSSLPEHWKNNPKVTIIEGSISKMDPQTLAGHVKGCQGVVSCLGHNLSFRGIYGPPRLLVTDAVKNLTGAMRLSTQPGKPLKFVLMNTTGNQNRDLDEPISSGQKFVIGLLRLLLPPHVDNEKAADYLRVQIGQDDPLIQWVAVRPDALIDETQVSNYDIFPSPVRSPIFDPGKTSRINVGNFMARLLTEVDLWETWQGKMPVIYNQ